MSDSYDYEKQNASYNVIDAETEAEGDPQSAEVQDASGNPDSLFKSPRLILDLIQHDEDERIDWGNDQRQFYNIRVNGISRTMLQPWMANLPYMHCDTEISNTIPQYIGHIYNSQLLADFVARDKNINIEQVAYQEQYFDYEMKNRSNFPKKILSVVDLMLMYGWCAVRVYYDLNAEQIAFEPLRPTDVVIPITTNEVQTGVRFAIKRVMSPVQFVLDKTYKQAYKNEAMLKKMSDFVDDETKQLVEDKQLYWGMKQQTGSIELYEFYQRLSTGEWRVYTVNKHIKDDWIADPITLDYKVSGKSFAPLVIFQREIMDVGGVYDSRGICQLLASDEAELTKNRNQMIDANFQCSYVAFESTSGVQNIDNYVWGPGKVIPQGLTQKMLSYPQAKFLETEQAILRRSERRLASPDTELAALDKPAERRTAKEVGVIQGQANQSTNYKFRVFRNSLCELYKFAYAILTYHRSEDEEVVIGNQIVTIPKAAKKAKYDIMPAGSEDVWNKETRLQQALQIYQLFAQRPWFDEAGYGRYLLALFDPRIANKFYVDVNQRMQTERVKQLQECLVMREGDMVPVSPQDMHDVHAVTTYQKIAQAAYEERPMSPQENQAMTKHMDMHLETLKTQDRAKYEATLQQIEKLKQATQQELLQRHQQRQAMAIGAQGGQPMPQPAQAPQQNVVPFPNQ